MWFGSSRLVKGAYSRGVHVVDRWISFYSRAPTDHVAVACISTNAIRLELKI